MAFLTGPAGAAAPVAVVVAVVEDVELDDDVDFAAADDVEEVDDVEDDVLAATVEDVEDVDEVDDVDELLLVLDDVAASDSVEDVSVSVAEELVAEDPAADVLAVDELDVCGDEPVPDACVGVGVKMGPPVVELEVPSVLHDGPLQLLTQRQAPFSQNCLTVEGKETVAVT